MSRSFLLWFVSDSAVARRAVHHAVEGMPGAVAAREGATAADSPAASSVGI
ncbi:MAG TPA: hypothetical protein VGO71_13000 [Baekduia sp.]|nr:hypothetical protein [Baekduia sp.]